MKTKFEPRKLMEQAVEVMRQSVSEPRTDGKASPLVGAVLYKPDGTVETACRGELRYGDHAEFTLLERKNRGHKLDDSILFATLEPCAPGAREPPKMSCAERIVLARIKEVWVGRADPDPKVDRRGIKYLEEAGIKVHMFDRDLQEVIKKENGDFIEQAMERAAEVKEPKKVVLSNLENAITTVATDDFSSEALNQYRTIAKIMEKVGDDAFNRRLLQQGLLDEERGTFLPTGFGLLLFGKEPRTVMPQAGLLATINYPDGTEETNNFEGPMVLIPDRLEKWLTDKLPNVNDRSRMQRRKVPALPFGMVREAVVNGLIHRDYNIRGAKCQLVVTVDAITVKSPGGPLPSISLAKLQSFSAPMLSRNPELHYVFARMRMAEERGLGLKTLKSDAEKLGLPLPSFTWEDPYLVLTLFRSQEAAARTLAPNVLESLSEPEQVGWQWLSTKGRTKSTQYANALKVGARTARRHLNHFVELDLVRMTGSGPSTEYEVI